MNDWNGQERRGDETNVRLALLEQAQGATERRHAENRESLVSLHKRISELGEKHDRGIDAIIDKLEADKKELKPTYDQIVTNTAAISWIKKWLSAVSALEVAICTWVLAHVTGKQ